MPDQEGRLEILNIHTRSQRETGILDKSADLSFWAVKTENYTGAEIKNLVDKATQYAMAGNFNPDADVLEVRKELKHMDQYAKITQEHFQKAFLDITPAFGINKNNFNFKDDKFIIYSDEVSSIKAKYEESLAALKEKDGLNCFRFLIAGENGTGKTELAKYLASLSDAKFIKVITPAELLKLPLSQKLDKLDQEFQDAKHSEMSIIILDDIENLLEADFDLSHPNNLIRIKLQSLLKNIEISDNKFIVIATASSEKFAKNLFPGSFNETNPLSNIVIRYSNKFDISKLAEITKIFNIKVFPPTEFKEDSRTINLPISKLIFEIKRFCLGREKTNLLKLDDFHKFLNGKPILKLAPQIQDSPPASPRVKL